MLYLVVVRCKGIDLGEVADGELVWSDKDTVHRPAGEVSLAPDSVHVSSHRRVSRLCSRERGLRDPILPLLHPDQLKPAM